MRAVWLIARTVLIEAIRRREIYAIVALSMLLIGAVMTVDFFQIEGLTKFYRDVALKIMSVATALRRPLGRFCATGRGCRRGRASA